MGKTIFTALFIIGFISTGLAQYGPDPANYNAVVEVNGFDYKPTNPLVVDYMNTRHSIPNPLTYPIVALDTTKTKWAHTDTGKTLIASGALIALGLYTYKDEGFMNRVDIKEGINRYLPDFENRIDDYTQYIPYAAVYALDAFGVKSKHKFWRKTSTIATAGGATLLVVQGMKYGIGELRPDGSANNAFPSGHTAAAFVGAHILHKEYGDRSIYYSIGGYFLAAFTGIFRQLNDRHWISDVLVGAGIGLSLTELAYFLNSKWWKDEGINDIEINRKPPNKLRPSFIGVKAGWAGLTDEFNDPEAGISAKNGFSLSVEGAWFFSRWLGVGGELGFQSFPIKLADFVQDEVRQEGFEFAFQPVGSSKTLIGPYIQWSKNKSMLGAKVLLGTARIADTEVFLQPLVDDDPTESDDITYAQIEPVTNFAWSTGIYYRWLIDERLALGVYLDYNATDLDSTLRFIDDFDTDPPTIVEEPLTGTFNSIAAGVSFSVMIW